MKTSEIITAIIATYGAVLSTIAMLRQYLSDRVKVSVKIRKNMQMVGDPRYEGITLTNIIVTNAGKRPVTIRSIGATGLYPNKSLVAVDARPQLPCEITEGKFIETFIDQDGLDFATIDFWAAWDSHGRIYKLSEASRWRHWKSMKAQRKALRKRKSE